MALTHTNSLRLLPLLGAAALGGLLAGCSHPGSGGQGGAGTPLTMAPNTGVEPPSVAGKYGGALVSSTISDPKTFNLWVSAETSSTDVVGPLYETLNRLNSYTLKFDADLSDLPKISADGLTYTYTLRPGLKWSDGQPITADDVIFTLTVIFDPTIQTNMRESMEVDVTAPDGTIKREPFRYRKVDDRTVAFTLPQKYAPAENILSSFPVAPKHKLEAAYKSGKFNSTWAVNTPPSELVSSGPWLIAEYVPGQRVVYKHNPNYWRKGVAGAALPYLDTETSLITPDLNTMILKFQSKETDVTNVPQNYYPDLKKGEAAGNYTVLDAGPGWGFSYLSFNMNPHSKVDKNLISLFQDVRFRQAVSYGLNRQRMCDDIFLGLAKPSYGPISPANTAFYDPNVPQYAYDPDKAKTLLAQIGLTAGPDGFLQYHGQEVKFNILTNTENDLRKKMATIIQSDMKTIGLNATFTPVNFNDLIRRLSSPPYDWQAVVLGFTGGPEPNDGSNIWRSSGNLHQWWPFQKTPATPWEAQIDKLFVQGAHELDPAKRKAIYDQWQEIVGTQQPLIFTVSPDSISAIRNHYGNLKPCSLGGLTWNDYEIFDTGASRTTP